METYIHSIVKYYRVRSGPGKLEKSLKIYRASSTFVKFDAKNNEFENRF